MSSFAFVTTRDDISLKAVRSRLKQVKGFTSMLSGNASDGIVKSVLCVNIVPT